jgi:hypothetical protein
MAGKDVFREQNWSAVPIRDLGLAIAGTPLEPVIEELKGEIRDRGIGVVPRFYLSTDWGVVTGTVAIAIPFYLAEPRLADLHAEKVGLIEGESRAELLRYLRHELGHVVNYAYKLYDEGEWVRLFGPITQPYLEEFRPSPFSRRYVRHLPGWYAQKHPDEDWAETFAVWMAPGLDWRAEYAEQPAALAKLEYCDRTMQGLRAREPLVTKAEAEEDVGELAYSVEQFYGEQPAPKGEFPRLFDGALRAIFEGAARDDAAPGRTRPASALIRAHERALVANVYRWTGHFPERTRALVRHLAERADELGLVCDESREASTALALTTFVSALAMNHVYSGNYLP